MGMTSAWVVPRASQVAVVNMIGDVNYYDAAFNPTHWHAAAGTAERLC